MIPFEMSLKLMVYDFMFTTPCDAVRSISILLLLYSNLIAGYKTHVFLKFLKSFMKNSVDSS
jgi:hypothetical protein